MKILYLPPIAYGDLKQRPQYLAEELARYHQVLYLDPTVSLMKFLLKGGGVPRGYHYQVNENLEVRRLSGILSAHRSFDALWRGFCIPERFQLSQYLRGADAVWIGYAPWYDLIPAFRGIVIYDKMDENAEITQNPLLRRLIERTERELVARADHLFVTAHLFYDCFRLAGLHPVLVPNAVERQQALRSYHSEYRRMSDSITFGYVGMISNWFDLDAVQTILDANPRNRVVLVGPSEIDLPHHDRLKIVGRVSKEQVGAWIEEFDVCLYPFRKMPLLDTINPVKLYEYLAANKPVLAVNSRELEKFKYCIFCYDTPAQLRALATQNRWTPPFADENTRREFINRNDWKSGGNIILEELRHESA